MDDLVEVAVVDGGEQLLHVHLSVLLGKHGLLDNLFKQLASLAKLGHDVVAFLVLEEFVEFEDIRVVLDEGTRLPAASGSPLR